MRVLPNGQPRPAAARMSWRLKSAGPSNAPGAVAPAVFQSAGACPPAAQKSPGCCMARASAPNPPIENPPMAIRFGSAPVFATASGIASCRRYRAHSPSRRLCQ
jgi:hypothetical protein